MSLEDPPERIASLWWQRQRRKGIDRDHSNADVAHYLPLVQQAHSLLAERASVEEIMEALERIGVRKRSNRRFAARIYQLAYRREYWTGRGTEGLAFQRKTFVATPGMPGQFGEDYFRSSWEKRTADVLSRLGVRWTYEPDFFTYPVAGIVSRYTPDFRLDDFANTYVEVKGPSGPDAADRIKLQKVVRKYPQLTLLLWDGGIVEYLEDADQPAVVVGLLSTTRM